MELLLQFSAFSLIMIGAAIAAVILIPASIFITRRAVMRLKVDMMQRLPMTLEQIDSDKEVIRAHHVVELCQLNLKIAEKEQEAAEARAATSSALSRIDELNRRLEVFQLKTAVKSKNKQIRKVDEQLIRLDTARNSVESAVV